MPYRTSPCRYVRRRSQYGRAGLPLLHVRLPYLPGRLLQHLLCSSNRHRLLRSHSHKSHARYLHRQFRGSVHLNSLNPDQKSHFGKTPQVDSLKSQLYQTIYLSSSHTIEAQRNHQTQWESIDRKFQSHLAGLGKSRDQSRRDPPWLWLCVAWALQF